MPDILQKELHKWLKEKCESRKLCDAHGNLIEYKVVEMK